MVPVNIRNFLNGLNVYKTLRCSKHFQDAPHALFEKMHMQKCINLSATYMLCFPPKNLIFDFSNES